MLDARTAIILAKYYDLFTHRDEGAIEGAWEAYLFNEMLMELTYQDTPQKAIDCVRKIAQQGRVFL